MKRTKQGNPKFRALRSKLRSQMTSPEQVMWAHLRLRQFYSLKFRRQHGIGNYIVDFYCSEKRVAIEVDGDTHAEERQMQLDKARELYLQSLGIRVFHYYNRDIVSNVEGVLEDLWQKLSIETSTLPNPPPPLPLRRAGLQREGITSHTSLSSEGGGEAKTLKITHSITRRSQ